VSQITCRHSDRLTIRNGLRGRDQRSAKSSRPLSTIAVCVTTSAKISASMAASVLCFRSDQNALWEGEGEPAARANCRIISLCTIASTHLALTDIRRPWKRRPMKTRMQANSTKAVAHRGHSILAEGAPGSSKRASAK